MAAGDRYDFDHVALASHDTSPALRFLTGRLGATVLGGGQAIGYRPMQVFVGDATGDGMAVELLEPWEPERNDFLARFLARRGEGPHHMTFKVPNLMAAVERAREHGLQPVKIDTSDPQWLEAFLMPADAHGTVVQLAESRPEFATRAESLAHVAAHGANGHPAWWVDPEPPAGTPAKLRRVVLRSPDAARATEFFAGFLHGEIEREGEGRIELLWPKRGARVAIEQHDGAAPGVDRLEVEGLDAPVEVIGARFVPPRI
jgi:catechol 2,3-dioxygenase-like lactoylglutathione lyase family enzyme